MYLALLMVFHRIRKRDQNWKKISKNGLCCHAFGKCKNPHHFSFKYFLETMWLDTSFCTSSSYSLLFSVHFLIIFLVASCQIRPFLLLSSHLIEMTGWMKGSPLQCSPSVLSDCKSNVFLFLFFVNLFQKHDGIPT